MLYFYRIKAPITDEDDGDIPELLAPGLVEESIAQLGEVSPGIQHMLLKNEKSSKNP